MKKLMNPRPGCCDFQSVVPRREAVKPARLVRHQRIAAERRINHNPSPRLRAIVVSVVGMNITVIAPLALSIMSVLPRLSMAVLISGHERRNEML